MQGKTIFSEGFFRKFSDLLSPHLDEAGISPSVLDYSNVEVLDKQYLRLWEVLGEKEDPNIGLLLGQEVELSDLGALGHAIGSAQTVGQALNTLSRFMVVLSQSSSVDIEISCNRIEVKYKITEPSVIYKRQDTEFVLSTLVKQLAVMANTVICPVKVFFEHQKPSDIVLHKSIFNCPLHFDQGFNAVIFDEGILDLPILSGDERLYIALEPYLEKMREERLDNLSDEKILTKVTRLIALQLSNGVPSLDDISSELNMSRRTLQRRLRQFDVEFSALLDDVRRELALEYVNKGEYSVTEVSLLLGYSEVSSFSRAFKRWTGETPQKYRSY